MGLTDFAKKQTGLTAVVVVLGAFIMIDLSIVFVVALKEAQAKSKAEGLDVFDYWILFLVFCGTVGKTIASFMNKSFTRWADQREEQHAEDRRIETETRRRANGFEGTPPPKVDPEGHLR